MKKLRDLLEKSTPGPWKDEKDNVPGAASYFDEKYQRDINLFSCDLDGYYVCSNKPDASLIVALRNCTEELIAVVEAVKDYKDKWGHLDSRTDRALKALERKVESL